MGSNRGSSVAVIVAHPDDETLWAGGAILLHPEWRCSLFSLCRGDDPDRAPRFQHAADRLGAVSAVMGLLDDGPDQRPLPLAKVEETVLELVGRAGGPSAQGAAPRPDPRPGAGVTAATGAGRRAPVGPAAAPRFFDIIITHSPHGEYTRHIRHEEAGSAVIELLRRGRLSCGELRLFAYEDDGRRRYPFAISVAPLQLPLPEEVWRAKVTIMTQLYGFGLESWEARTTPKTEAFWTFAEAGTAALAFDVEGGAE